MDARASEIWTALPCRVESFDSAACTITAEPLIQARLTDPRTGAKSDVALPLLPDVPVMWPHGGGCSLTFPLKKGDECLVLFASRCIDSWWASGDPSAQAELRMHDLSDGFAIPGPWSRPKALTGYSGDAVQLRSDDGQAFIEINPQSHNIRALTSGNITGNASGNISADAGGNVAIKAVGTARVESAGNMTLAAPMVIVNGNMQINGSISQGTSSGGTSVQMIGPMQVQNDITAGGVSVASHTHGGVESGGGNTTGPNG